MSTRIIQAELQFELEQARARVAELEVAIEALKSENQLKSLLNAMPDAMLIIDTEGMIQMANAQATGLFGYTQDELLGSEVERLISDRDHGEYVENRAEFMSQPGFITGGIERELFALHKDGSAIPVEVYSSHYALMEGETVVLCSIRNVMERKRAKDGNPLAISGPIQDVTDRKLIDEVRRESDKRYHLLFQHMVQGVVFQNDDGRIIHANPAAERILGLSLDQMQGRRSIDPRWHSIHEDGSEFPGDEHPSMVSLRTGKPVHDVVMGVYNSQLAAYRWININAVPRFFDGSEKPYQVFATFEDITEGKRVELELRESEKRLRSMLEISQAMSVPLEMNTILQKIVENAAGLLQLDSGAIYTLRGSELFLEATTPPLSPNFPNVLCLANLADHPHIQTALSCGSTIILPDTSTAELSNAEKVVIEARGLRSIAYIPLMISKKAIGVLIVASVNELRTFSDEEIALYAGFSGQAAQTIENIRLYQLEREYAIELKAQIVERKQAEDSLRESERKYHDLINGMNDTVWVIDADTMFIDVNDAAVRALGYTREELLSMKVGDIDTAIAPDQIRQLIEKLAHDSLQVFETRHKAKDGRIIPVEVSSSLIPYMGRTVIMSIARDITERKTAQENLLLAERRYRALIENAPDGIALISADGKFKYVSPSAQRIMGFGSDEVPESNPVELTHPEDRGMVLEKLAELLQNPAYVPTIQYRFQKKNGEWCWIESTFSNLLAQPNVEAIIINFRDIHERKAAEEALTRSQALLMEAQRIGRIGYIEWNSTNEQLICSDEIYNIFELPRETVVSQNVIAQMMPPEERKRIELLDMLAIQQRNDMEYEFGFRIKDGSIRWLHQMGKMTYDEYGVPTRMMAIIQDVTERKKTEQTLSESRTRLEMALKGAKAGMWDWNVQTGETVFNDRWAEIAGYSLHELEPISIKTWIGLCHPDDLKRSNDRLQQHFSGETEFYTCEARMKHKNGSWVWVIDQGKVMEWDENGNPIRMFGTHLDITKQKQEELYTQTVLRLTNLSYATSNMEDLMRTMLDEAEALTDSTIGFFHFVDNEQNTINLQAWSTNTLMHLRTAEGEDQHYAVNQAGMWADALRSDEAQIYNDYSPLAHQKGLPDSHSPITRLISLPIKRNNLVVAALGVGNKPQDYTEQDLDILKSLAETIFDIIMRKRVEEALRKNEEHLRTVADFTYDMEFWLDEHKQLLYISPSCKRITGYDQEQFLNNPSLLRSIIHPEDQPVFDRHSTEEFNLLESYALDFRIITAEGMVRWINHTCQAVPGENGTSRGRRVSHRDITERRRVLENLRASEEKYRLLSEKLEERVKQRTAEVQDLYEHAPVGYHSLDGEGRIVMINQTELDWLGYTREELIGRHFVDLFLPESREMFETNFLAFREHGWMQNLEFELVRKDSSTFPALINATAIKDEFGNFLMSRTIIFDNTERRKAEVALRFSRDQLSATNAALQKASQAKNEFLANMSHELRTPLNGILGMAEILQEEIRGPLNQNQRRMVAAIESSGGHLLSLINDILDLSKIEAGKLELYLEQIIVVDICQTSLIFIKEPATKKSIQVGFDLDPQVVTMRADVRRLKQILINLLSNAVKFTPAKGNVTLQVRGDAERQTINFSVIDTGIGISTADLSRLFTPFTQVDSSLTRAHEGTGLGLALVMELVELHGGNVRVESEVGKGSTFTVCIPWQRIPEKNIAKMDTNPLEPAASEQPSEQNQPELLGKILLAEDMETNTMVISDYLENVGYAIFTAANGQEAIERAQEHTPDLILMDIQMPVMDGLQATRWLRADQRFATVPIIALTALAMTGDRERCLEAGATDYLSKPIKLKQLSEMIKHLLNPKG